MRATFLSISSLCLLLAGVGPLLAMRARHVLVWPICVSPRLALESRRAALVASRELSEMGFQPVIVSPGGDFGHDLPEEVLALKARTLDADAVVRIEVTDAQQKEEACDDAPLAAGRPYLAYAYRGGWDPRTGRWVYWRYPVAQVAPPTVAALSPPGCGRGFLIKLTFSLINAYTSHVSWSKNVSGWGAGTTTLPSIEKQVDALIPKLKVQLGNLPL